jgi:ATP-grasp domain, R2K clade family 2
MINWLVDTLLTERYENTGFPILAGAARELGHKVYQTKYVPFSERPDCDVPFEDGQCVVTYGTVQFCRQIEKYYGRMWMPAMYFNENVKHWAKFAVHIGEDLLNSDYVILPYGEVVRRLKRNKADNYSFSWFIKPESGMKEFTGQVINTANLDDDLSKLSPHASIDDDVLCVCAPPKNIKAEFRYVICEKKVITGSEYRWDDILDVRSDTHPLCDHMANKIASAEWQADTVYVCDVALVEDSNGFEQAKVIELNAFSSSGLYACDTYKIVEAVSKAAEKEHAGILD